MGLEGNASVSWQPYSIVNDLRINRINSDSRDSLASHPVSSSKPKNLVPCPHCGSKNIILGAGKKPGEESRRCGDCKHFLGYSSVSRLKKARKRRELTECLQLLEDSGIQDELALFTLSLANDGGEG